ncbi:MAG: transglycosylase domain-containing protein [bacterium]|nr:transglycosylase domain-containing protein [bacterium]
MKHIRKIARRLVKLYWMILLPLFLFSSLFYFFILKDLPSPTKLASSTIPQSTKIYDRNGSLLYTIYADRNQTFVPLSEIPKSVQKATIAIEDKDFYRHGAIDLRGIARAAYSTLFHKKLQGGSTLTQQLVKTTLLSPERTIQRKVKEVILSFITEMLYSKDRILEMYLNQVPYGGTSYGIESASQTYFGKKARELTLAEAALLAGLPEAPSTYSPFGAYPELGKKRQEIILSKMQEQGYITKTEKEKAQKEQLKFQKIRNVIRAPHFVLYVKDLLEQKYGKKVVEEGGLLVTTSLDLTTQEYAQASVAAEVAGLKGYRVTNGAALVTKPGTGEILAMVGSRGYFSEETDGNVNITLQHLQPGSSIKPINYAVGLLKGYTAATPFVDEKVCFSGPKPYCPVNYDGKFHGAVQMRYALGNSFNIPAVQMLKLNTVEDMIATATAMGITTFDSPDTYGLSLTLGGGEVRMIDMAVAFGVFANGGYRIDLHPVLKVVDKRGKVLEEYNPPQSPIFGKKVLPSGVAFIISNILQDNGARLEAFGPNSALRIGNKPVAVKTGTTNDYRDNWTIGYTPEILVAAWVGNNDHTPMSGIASGVTGAAPIWHNIMGHLLEGETVPLPHQPSSVIEKFVCAPSGLLPQPEGTPDRCQTRKEFFIKGTEPRLLDKGRQKVFIDKTTNDLAKQGQTDNVEERDEIVVTDSLGNRFCLSCPHPVPSPTPTP